MIFEKISIFLQNIFYLLYPVSLGYLFYNHYNNYNESMNSCVNFLNKLSKNSSIQVERRIYFSLKDQKARQILKKILCANVHVYDYKIKGDNLYVVLLPTSRQTRLIKQYYKSGMICNDN